MQRKPCLTCHQWFSTVGWFQPWSSASSHQGKEPFWYKLRLQGRKMSLKWWGHFDIAFLHDARPPSRSTVYHNLRKCQETGTSVNRNAGRSGRPRTARTAENIAAVQENSPTAATTRWSENFITSKWAWIVAEYIQSNHKTGSERDSIHTKWFGGMSFPLQILHGVWPSATGSLKDHHASLRVSWSAMKPVPAWTPHWTLTASCSTLPVVRSLLSSAMRRRTVDKS